MIDNIVLYFLFNILMIAVFTFIYYNMREGFGKTREGREGDFIDYFSLSTTLQSTVGLTDVLPTTDRTKLLVNFQQILSIGGFAVLLYYLNLKDLVTPKYNY
jgi:hypothetical protein